MPQGTNYDYRLSNRMSEQTTADDDAGLVALSQKGDLAAFEQLVTKHQRKMFNIAFRIAGDHDDASETVMSRLFREREAVKACLKRAWGAFDEP